MELSVFENGYKLMGEYIQSLNIDSVRDQKNVSMYKGIQTCLTFISSDMFGKLCAEKHDEIAKEPQRIKALIDETHNVREIRGYAVLALGGGLKGFESSDRFHTIHRIYTDGISDEEYNIKDDPDDEIASDKAIHYEISKLIFDTMGAVAVDVLKQASHTKINAHAKIELDFDLGEFSSEAEANRYYGHFMFEFRHSEMSVENEFKCKKKDSKLVYEDTYYFLTKDELIKEYEEDEVYNPKEEYDDNVRLGIIHEAIPFMKEEKDTSPRVYITEHTAEKRDYISSDELARLFSRNIFIAPKIREYSYLIDEFDDYITHDRYIESIKREYDVEGIYFTLRLKVDVERYVKAQVLNKINVKFNRYYDSYYCQCMKPEFMDCKTLEYNHNTKELKFFFSYDLPESEDD